MNMHQWRVPVLPALARYVAAIRFEAASVTDTADAGQRSYQVLPTPFPVLGFQYRGRLRAVRDSTSLILAPAGITGLQSTARSFEPDADTGTILVVLQPYAVYTLLGIPADALANAHVDLAAITATPPLRDLLYQLATAGDDANRARLVQSYLLALLPRAEAPHPSLVAATERIMRAHGALRISALARDLALSRRQLERLYKLHTGVGPKEFASLARFDWAAKSAITGASWSMLAYEAGYADQSHLIRDFQARVGLPPTAARTQLRGL